MQKPQQITHARIRLVPGSARNRPQYGVNVGGMAGNLLTIMEFCLEARISLRQYHRMRERAVGPRVTVLDGRKLIARSELERWLRSHTEPKCGVCPPAYGSY